MVLMWEKNGNRREEARKSDNTRTNRCLKPVERRWKKLREGGKERKRVNIFWIHDNMSQHVCH